MSTRRQSLEDRAFAVGLFLARKGTHVRLFTRPSPFYRRNPVYTAASEALAAAFIDGVTHGRQPVTGVSFDIPKARFIDTASIQIERDPGPDEPTLFDVTP